jgi:hypothetical protein
MRLDLTVWHPDTFAVALLRDGIHSLPDRAELVRGVVSGPFGIYRGTPSSTKPSDSRKRYTLVHLPTQIAQLTLPRQGLCREAAQELGQCDLGWHSAWHLDLVGPIEEMEKAREVHRRWSTFGVRKSWGER